MIKLYSELMQYLIGNVKVVTKMCEQFYIYFIANESEIKDNICIVQIFKRKKSFFENGNWFEDIDFFFMIG